MMAVIPGMSRGRCYRDFQNRVLFVSPGLTNGTTWMTCYQRPSGGLRRVKSKFLPLRQTREQAQADLDRWAKERGLEEVDGR